MRTIFIALCFLPFLSFSQDQPDPLLQTLDTELKREVEGFSKAALPPYYMAYRVDDIHSAVITASFGSLVGTHVNHSRMLFTDVRVGSYEFDDSHTVEAHDDVDFPQNFSKDRGISLPVDDSPLPIQVFLWQQTSSAYRSALNTYKSIKGLQKKSTTPVPDFTKENAYQFVDRPLVKFPDFFDQAEWEKRIRKYSDLFLASSDIVEGQATVQVGTERKYFVSSEGTRIAENRTFAYLTISGTVRAEDGDMVPLHQSYFAFAPKQLPAEATILKDVDVMISKLGRLRKAPVAEPYTGPAILHARAAGVFFHEIFGHRVEGSRLKDNQDGQTFKDKLNVQVLPITMNVDFDPSLTSMGGQALNGYYQYDDEGVKGQKVRVVDKGVLRTFLMSRTPIEHFSNSNGHGRAQAGQSAVSRQSNLIIENEKPVSMADLRKMLIKECQKQKKSYGYLFQDVVGGFTTTDRFMPNAFNIFPVEVYRIYVDGRPDELVRGVDLIGTPLAMFAEIKAADDKREVFTGFCGARSGSVPVTAISPSLFVKRIETQKKPVRVVEQTLLARPAGK